MPSRRIVSSPNLAPVQDNAVNPFGTFNSDTVNKLTRIVSKGSDGVICGLDVEPIIQPTYISKTFELPADLSDSNIEYENVSRVNQSNYFDIYNMSTNNIDYANFKLAYIQYKFTNSYLDKYYGKNISKVFEFSFTIASGNPKQIIAFVDGDASFLDYPRYTGNQCTIRVKHNFSKFNSYNGKKYLKLGLKFNLDILDEKCQYSASSSDGKTYIRISIPTIKIYDIPLTSEKEDYITNHTIDGNISNNKVHPSNKFQITKGMSIKDDVLLNAIGIFNSNISSILQLDIRNPKSWIKENPYQPSDFYISEVEKQKLYILNGSNSTTQYVESSIDQETGKLSGIIDDITIHQVDDYELCDWDKPINISVSSPTDLQVDITIPECEIDDIYGNSFLLYYIKNSVKIVFKKIVTEIDIESYKTKQYKISINSSEIECHVDDIKCVQSGGPVKVSGDINEYNNKLIKKAHVVCYYSYFKNPEPNISYYGLIRDEDLNDLIFREDYLVLATLRMTDVETYDIISYDLRQKITTPSDINAIDIQYSNSLTSGENGFYEFNCWRKDPSTPLQNEDVPNTVSKALTELAHRRLGDINEFNSKIFSLNNFIQNSLDMINENEFLIRNITTDKFSASNSLIGNIDSNKNNTLASYSNYSLDTPVQFFNLIDTETKVKYTVCDNEFDAIKWKGSIENNQYAIFDIQELIEFENKYFDEYISKYQEELGIDLCKFSDIHNDYIDKKYFLVKIKDYVNNSKESESSQVNIDFAIIDYFGEDYQYISNQNIPLLFRKISSGDYINFSVLDIDDSKYSVENSILDDILEISNDKSLIKSIYAKLPSKGNQQDLLENDNNKLAYEKSIDNDYIIIFNPNGQNKLGYSYIKERIGDYKPLSTKDLIKYIDIITPQFSASTKSNSLAYWDSQNKTLEISDYTVDDVSKLSDLPESDSSEKSKIVYYANNKLNVSDITVDDVSKLSDLPESDGSEENKIVYYSNNKLNVSDVTIDDLDKLDQLNNIKFDNTDEQYIVSANKNGLNKSNVSIQSLSSMSTSITELSSTMYINDDTYINNVDYDNTNYWSDENNKYSKSYKMAANGTLLISFRWDCSGADGIGYEILKSDGTTLIQQKLTENAEFNNSSGLHVNMSLNLGKNITFRFVSENGFLNAQNTFLQYRACYKENPDENNE